MSVLTRCFYVSTADGRFNVGKELLRQRIRDSREKYKKISCAKRALVYRLDITCDRGCQMSCHRTKFVVHFFVAGAFIFGDHAVAQAQGSISEVSQRPFVVGVIPVVGNGGVGGVAIDANGVMAKAEERDVVALRDARRDAISALAGDVSKRSALRKISLCRLDTVLARHVSENKPL